MKCRKSNERTIVVRTVANSSDYDVRWMKRTKKQGPPRAETRQDRMRFQKSRDYLVRIDDMLVL